MFVFFKRFLIAKTLNFEFYTLFGTVSINKKIKSKPILQMLESTIAKIENYQNIRRNNINY